MSDPVQYVCAICGGEFVSTQPDEEAIAALQRRYPGISKEKCAQVCAECFKTKVTEQE